MEDESSLRCGSNERGAALLIALLAMMFLTILGMALLEVLKGGMVQAVSTEASVQAEGLAQRGLDEAVALIRDAVDTANASSSYEAKVTDIQNAVTSSTLSFLDGSRVTTANGYYEIEVVTHDDNYSEFSSNIGSMPTYPYGNVITVKCTAVVDEQQGLKRKVSKEARIYVSTINPVFKYPVSAVDDLSLFGAPYVIGDILSRQGNMNVFDQAVFIGSPGSRYRMATAGPTVKGFYKLKEGQRIIRKDPSDPDPTKWIEQSSGTTFDGIDPFEDPLMPNDSDIGVLGTYVEPKMTELNDLLTKVIATVDSGEVDGYIIGPNISSDIKYLNQWVTFPSVTEISNANFIVKEGVLTMESAAKVKVRKGSIYVDYVNPSLAAATFAGELSIDPSEAVVVRGNAVITDQFKLTGNMYIQGSLKIIGSVEIDGTIYVDGDVEMKEMQSINKGLMKPLILAASGKLMFSDSRPAEVGGVVPSTEIRAFLYSEQDISLYGIQSKIAITGGIHGKNVTLQALREGDIASRISSPEILVDRGDTFNLTSTAEQLSLSPEHSNLKVFFDDKLYTSPPVGIPITNSIHTFVTFIDSH